jgi:hypothetical protein
MKKPLEGNQAPQRLRFQTLGVAISHGHLKKVRVALKVYRKTDLSEIRKRIDVFRGDVQLFYVIDIAPD